MHRFKGTKGEWKVNKLEATDFYLERNEVQYGEDGECVAEFVANDYDAKLIANSPKLLKALQDIIISIESMDLQDGTLFKASHHNAVKAIKKALL